MKRMLVILLLLLSNCYTPNDVPTRQECKLNIYLTFLLLQEIDNSHYQNFSTTTFQFYNFEYSDCLRRSGGGKGPSLNIGGGNVQNNQ